MRTIFCRSCDWPRCNAPRGAFKSPRAIRNWTIICPAVLVESEEAAGHYTEKLILASTLLTYQQRIIAAESIERSRAFRDRA